MVCFKRKYFISDNKSREMVGFCLFIPVKKLQSMNKHEFLEKYLCCCCLFVCLFGIKYEYCCLCISKSGICIDGSGYDDILLDIDAQLK